MDNIVHSPLLLACVGTKRAIGGTTLMFLQWLLPYLAQCRQGELINKCLNTPRISNETILTMLCVKKYEQPLLLELLLEYSTNPNYANRMGRWTPLHAAVKRNHVNYVEMLIKNGANVNKQKDNGFTPLHLTALNSWTHIMLILLKNRANPSIQTSNVATSSLSNKTPEELTVSSHSHTIAFVIQEWDSWRTTPSPTEV
jgi:ankyrin repeat protein